eukprot:3907989-Ditylum_brightwellii.AAC.1
MEEHYNLLQDLDWKSSLSLLTQSANLPQTQHFFAAIDHFDDPLTGYIDSLYLPALASQIADSDIPTWGKAIRGRNVEGFWEAMWVEMVTLMKMKAFEIFPRTKDMHMIMSTWVFHIKNFPTCLI